MERHARYRTAWPCCFPDRTAGRRWSNAWGPSGHLTGGQDSLLAVFFSVDFGLLSLPFFLSASAPFR